MAFESSAARRKATQWTGGAACAALAASFLSGVPTRAVRPEDMPPRQFLALARRPPVKKGWLRASGIVQYRRGDESVQDHAINVIARFGNGEFRSRIVVDGTNRYRVRVVFPLSSAGELKEEISVPERDVLRELGMRASDFSFSFLYWSFVQELPRDVVNGQPCRVFILHSPTETQRWVHVWLHSRFAFPLRIVWYDSKRGPPSRTMELRDFKRSGGLWYLRECRIQGSGWKSRVILRDIDLALDEDTPPPKDVTAELGQP